MVLGNENSSLVIDQWLKTVPKALGAISERSKTTSAAILLESFVLHPPAKNIIVIVCLSHPSLCIFYNAYFTKVLFPFSKPSPPHIPLRSSEGREGGGSITPCPQGVWPSHGLPCKPSLSGSLLSAGAGVSTSSTQTEEGQSRTSGIHKPESGPAGGSGVQ